LRGAQHLDAVDSRWAGKLDGWQHAEQRILAPQEHRYRESVDLPELAVDYGQVEQTVVIKVPFSHSESIDSYDVALRNHTRETPSPSVQKHRDLIRPTRTGVQKNEVVDAISV
jgi:hypothetical protein